VENEVDYSRMSKEELVLHRSALERLALRAVEKGREDVFNQISEKIARVNEALTR